MPPAAVGAFFVGLGASAATGAAIAAVTTAVYVGAAYGAVVGAATALVSGGDILEGAVKGAVIGGISGGVLKGVGIATGAETVPTEAGVSKVGEAGLKEGVQAAGNEAYLNAQYVPPGTNAPPATPQAPGTPPPNPSTGILSRAGQWIEKNPTQAVLAAQTVGGMAKGASEAKAAERDIAAQMEMNRLNIQAGKVSGLDRMQLRTVLPNIAGFTAGFKERPKWQMPEAGLLEGAKNA